MAAIDIRRPHGLGLQTARERAEQLAREMQGKLGVDWHWDGDRIRFRADRGSAKGASGSVSVSDQQVRVEIDLPLMLRPMKGMISGRVSDKLDQLIG